MTNEPTVMKLVDALNFRMSNSRSAQKMVKQVEFSSKVTGITFGPRQYASLRLIKYASSENKRTGGNIAKLIKHFALLIDKRASAKQKKQNWNSYFSGQIQI